MERIKRFIETKVPVTACNMKCSYCYVAQHDCNTGVMPKFPYSAEHIGRALSKERLGGRAFINLCGDGETLLPPEMVDIIRELLRHGHVLKIVTNMTLTDRLDAILAFPPEYLKNILFTCSFHYLELLRLNRLDSFFENFRKAVRAGASAYLQMQLCEEYILYMDEIKERCVKELGDAPHLALTRDEHARLVRRYTDRSFYEMAKQSESYDTLMYRTQLINFDVPRPRFCYAGDWSFFLNICTGEVRKCYGMPVEQNIYKRPEGPIRFEAIGRHCPLQYCTNGDTFLVFGLAPERYLGVSYGDTRFRASSVTPEMRDLLNSIRLYETNAKYDQSRKRHVNAWYRPMIYHLKGVWNRIKK